MLKILLVDDEPFVREGLRGLVDWNKLGYYICGEAENGIEALEMISQLEPHLIISDVKMPGMDGLELTKKVVCDFKYKTRIIILSGYNEFKFAQTAIKYGVKNYLLKPIDEDELIEILLQLRSEIEEEIRIERERAVSTRAVASETIRKLIKGDCSGETLSSAEKWLNIENNRPFTYVTLEIADFRNWINDLDQEQIQQRLSDIYRVVINVVKKENVLNILEEEVYRYGIVVNSSILSNYHNSIEVFCRSLYDRIIGGTKSNVAVYVGKAANKVAMFKECYDSCFQARERRFFEKDSGVTFYEEVKDISFNYKLSVNISFNALINSIENRDVKQIQKSLEGIFDSMYTQFLPPSVVRAYIIEFVLTIIKLISDKNGDTDGLLAGSRINDVYSLTMEELKSTMYRFCIMSADYIKTLKEKQSPGILTDVINYVKRNYNKSINLKSIAEHYYINPVYLGQLFKKNYGTYFNDYLNSLRVEEAKRLLTETELKIYEVAEKVGYADSDYFISKFEKIIGQTPTQYRGR